MRYYFWHIILLPPYKESSEWYSVIIPSISLSLEQINDPAKHFSIDFLLSLCVRTKAPKSDCLANFSQQEGIMFSNNGHQI